MTWQQLSPRCPWPKTYRKRYVVLSVIVDSMDWVCSKDIALSYVPLLFLWCSTLGLTWNTHTQTPLGDCSLWVTACWDLVDNSGGFEKTQKETPCLSTAHMIVWFFCLFMYFLFVFVFNFLCSSHDLDINHIDWLRSLLKSLLRFYLWSVHSRSRFTVWGRSFTTTTTTFTAFYVVLWKVIYCYKYCYAVIAGCHYCKQWTTFQSSNERIMG